MISQDICNILSRIGKADKVSKDSYIKSFAILNDFASITKGWQPKLEGEWAKNGTLEYDALMIEYGFINVPDIRKDKVCEKLEIGYAIDTDCEDCGDIKDPKQRKVQAFTKLRAIVAELQKYKRYTVVIHGNTETIWETPSNIAYLKECDIIESFDNKCIGISDLMSEFKAEYYEWNQNDLPSNVCIVTVQLSFCHCQKVTTDHFDYSYVKDKPKSVGAIVRCSKC